MVYCILANGFEIIEAMSPVDVLKRAKVDVKLIGLEQIIESSNGTKIICDDVIDNISFDSSIEAVILPGGMPGTINLENNNKVQELIEYCIENNKLVCAICAAPSILGHKELLIDKEATAFPGFEKDLKGANISDKYVVKSGNIITARGAGVSIEFGLEIISALKDAELSNSIKKSIQYFER